MVYWITGKAGAGKTVKTYSLKHELENKGEKVFILDGDEVREKIKAGFTDEERYNHIMRISAFASLAEDQGFIVIISLISPRRQWRKEARKLFKESEMIYIKGGTLWKGTTYEEPDSEEL